MHYLLTHSELTALKRRIPAERGAFLVDELLPLQEVKTRYILHVLDRCGGNQSHAAKELEISREIVGKVSRTAKKPTP